MIRTPCIPFYGAHSDHPTRITLPGTNEYLYIKDFTPAMEIPRIRVGISLRLPHSADSGRSRPPFRDDGAHRSEMMAPTIPR